MHAESLLQQDNIQSIYNTNYPIRLTLRNIKGRIITRAGASVSCPPIYDAAAPPRVYATPPLYCISIFNKYHKVCRLVSTIMCVWKRAMISLCQNWSPHSPEFGPIENILYVVEREVHLLDE